MRTDDKTPPPPPLALIPPILLLEEEEEEDAAILIPVAECCCCCFDAVVKVGVDAVVAVARCVTPRIVITTHSLKRFLLFLCGLLDPLFIRPFFVSFYTLIRYSKP